ncbi:MAG: type II secretion system protein M [Piscirickettsiaceae bacterium]|nr:type II secretion system protein M [Piscirickettsiaceae bacterium]
MKSSVQQWWQTLVIREKQMVAALAVVIIFLLFQVMIIGPLYQGRENATHSLDKQVELLQWMQDKTLLAKQLQQQNPLPKMIGAQSISQRINSTAKRAKIDISRFQTAGSDNVQVWLEQVEFSTLLLWLETMQKKHGVQVESIAISETSKSGRVSVRATLTTS